MISANKVNLNDVLINYLSVIDLVIVCFIITFSKLLQ